jgi:hypothetical protein
MSGERMRTGGHALLRVAAVALGLGLVWFVSSSGAVDPAALTAFAIAAAAATATALVLAARGLGAVIAALVGITPVERPRDDADLPVAIVQSRPDAPGRPRTRAPGRLLAAA